ncbi:cache domain-containing sensor histidine kinase [Paenibacillus hamazuiensis]|uniref:cache domain-containing sensor histidine kinase n=1 Tax=Paenibacillus hamazuiensis TaxID=2936508 RepID=UPI00200BEA11|nr:sensor histidine kinase [Paenibacillus hamazuiensis]
MKMWRLKPFLFCVLVLSNIFFLLVITVAIYFSVSYFFTKQISSARLEVLYSNQLKLIERLKDIEGTALAISAHPIAKKVLEDNAGLDMYDYILLQRTVTDWLSTLTYIKPFINSIQIYTDRYPEYQKIGQAGKNIILPVSKIPWKEHMPRFDSVDAVWIPSHRDEYSDGGPKPVLTYVLKVYDRRGAAAGFIAVNLQEDSLARLFYSESEDTSPTNRSLLLLDADGRIMSGMSAQVNAPLMATFREHAESLGGQSGFRHIRAGGSRYLMIYSKNNREKWSMVEFLESDALYRDVNAIRNIMLLIGVIVLLVVFPVSSYLSSRIIRPVPHLLKGFQQIESGNFHASLEAHTIVEFNKLVSGFNAMADRLRGMMEELERKNRLKRDLELTVLQSQINPHFLYNTLDMINWAAAVKGNTEVSFMAARLAKLFRISLSGGSAFILLQEELEHARLYAQIQQTRLEDRFSYIEQIDPLLRHCYVPKIILQPFIENAIIHGFSSQYPIKAEVTVRADKLGEERMRLTIADNGVGMGKTAGEAQKRKGSSLYVSGTGGYGIKNVRERLGLYLGNEYELRIENGETQGVQVTITLPLLDSPEKVHRFKDRYEGVPI